MNNWVNWAKQIHAISQIGKTYGTDPYDLDRYRQLEVISQQMLAQLADAPVAKVANFFVPDSGYATPKVDLRAGVFKDDRILLVKEKTDGAWSLPGGWADVNESPRVGIEREVREESGYSVKAIRLAAIKDRSLHDYTPQYPDHLFKLFFLCTLEGGDADIDGNIEISDVDFFRPDDLPPLSAARVLAADIELLTSYYRNPHQLPYFD